MKFVKSRGKRTLEKVRNANEKLRETRGGGTMRKTMEQIVLEGQVAKCRSIEELYVLWELMQQMEEDPFGNTCYPELDQRNFHVDGIADPEHYDGTLYILKETNMRKMIQKGETMPVASDIRADFLSGKSPSGRVEYLDYPFFGLILAAAMCYPAIQNVDINLWGYVVNTTYTSTFLPILFGLLAAVPLYKWFDKVLPKMIKGFMTPMLTLIIIFPLTFIVIGPLANMIGAGLNVVLTSICEFSPLLAGLILGGCWQIFVLFGIHGVLTIFAFMDLLAGNPSQLLAFSYGASFATCGVLLSIILKTKDAKLKEVALPSFISAIFGVTEPGTYGVTLPRKKMFAICCIGGAASGVVVALSNLAMYSYAGMGIMSALLQHRHMKAHPFPETFS